MKATTMTLKQAAEGVKLKAEWILTRPDGLMEDIGWNGTHWRITLTRRATKRRTWRVYWSQGSAHGNTPPEVLDVLESLWLDVQGVEGAGYGTREHSGFENWCREYGYDTDSRKAEKVYRACVKAARAWGRFWDGVDITSGDET